jgi:hypothetical protein
MASCGVCGGKISNTLTPHGAICDDDVMAPSINDLMKAISESEMEDEHE